MLTVFSSKHHLHHGIELKDGLIGPSFEKPQRADTVLDRVKMVQLGEIIGEREFDRSCYVQAHSERYISFLENAWSEWKALGRNYDALPLVWPVRDLAISQEPNFIDGKLGFYSMDAGCPITAGTWEAIKASADTALTACEEIIKKNIKSAFALCRPPGHHAAREYMGGYCYLNNAAIAAEYALTQGFKKVAILDVDFHHGNGTQTIFYDRDNVFFASIHGHPRDSYPYFSGFESELGIDAGLGFNANFPLNKGTKWIDYKKALESSLVKIKEYGADFLIISLGVDTFKDDPISHFCLESTDYLEMGRIISQINQPTLFVMEGGYMVDEIGINVVNTLLGFEGKF
ncbi:hypothetical protein F884_02997 [Acinetobacter sp. CIP 102143]|uniref:histone deacetylase family protein n=1 Tax=Acinetobacter sp. CIP 102143 TaxID=1144666 RepID=UPI0002CE815B|nr:histone deacetylase family protein [Acinetobacter sp. CIP 102143]ENX59806.1 hypothetical protein F884_02997 [Acinetobacter sp. CIP 102143]